MKICTWCTPQEHNEIDDWHIHGRGGAIIFGSAMMDRNSVIQAGGFDEKLKGAENICLMLRLAEIGQIINLKTIVTFYRQHIKSISHDKKLIIHRDTQQVINNACERRGIPRKNLNFKNEFNSSDHIYNKWGWWALKGNNIKTTRKYAFKALLINPFNTNVWRLLACSLRGY